MDDELNDVKATLRAVAVSTPARLDAMSLLRDYRKLVFSYLPVRKFGYRDPVKFLREKCGDCFLGSPSNPELTLIVPRNIQHLDRWVRHQKMPPHLQHIGRRRSVLERQVTPAQNNASLQADTRQDTPGPPSPPPVENIANSLVYRKKPSLEELKRQISEIIADHPKGVWVIDLLDLYKERHSRELDFMRHGYMALVTLAMEAEDVLAIRYPRQGDYLLINRAHAAASPPPRPLPRLNPLLYERPRSPIGPDEALPGVPYDKDLFPEDCMGLNQRIPAASLADVKLEDSLPVIVTEVYSPSHFWMMRIGEDYAALTVFKSEMNKYYESGEGRDRRLNPGNIREGYYCTARYEGEWHRTLIVKIVDCTTVKVRYVDYGTVEKHDMNALRLLLRRWGALPAQALRARLTAVRPYGLGRRWSIRTTARFLELVSDRRLVAVVYAIDMEDRVLEVDLVNTPDQKDVCIGDELLSEGHAHPAAVGTAISASECYLFPQFAPLERAATFNYAEVCDVLNYGFVLDRFEPFKRFVPPETPPRVPWEPVVLPATPPATPPRPASPALSPPRPASPAACPPATLPSPAACPPATLPSPDVCPPATSPRPASPGASPPATPPSPAVCPPLPASPAACPPATLPSPDVCPPRPASPAACPPATLPSPDVCPPATSPRPASPGASPPATPPSPAVCPPRPASPAVSPPRPPSPAACPPATRPSPAVCLPATPPRPASPAASQPATLPSPAVSPPRPASPAASPPATAPSPDVCPPVTPPRPASPAVCPPAIPPRPASPAVCPPATAPLPTSSAVSRLQCLQQALKTTKAREIERLLASLRRLDLATAITVTTTVETLILNAARTSDGPSLDALTPPATPFVCPPALSQPLLAPLPFPLQQALEMSKSRTIERLLAWLRQLDLATAITVTTTMETMVLNAKVASERASNRPLLDAFSPPATPQRSASPGVCPPAPSQPLLAPLSLPLPLQQALETSLARTIERLLASLRQLDLATAFSVTTNVETLMLDAKRASNRPLLDAFSPPATPQRPASPGVCPPAPSQPFHAPLPLPLQLALETTKSRMIESLLASLRQLDLATAFTVMTNAETLVLNAKGASDRPSLDALTPSATPSLPASPGVCPPAPSQPLPLQQAIETSLARTIERLLASLRRLDLATAFCVTTAAQTLVLDAKQASDRALARSLVSGGRSSARRPSRDLLATLARAVDVAAAARVPPSWE